MPRVRSLRLHGLRILNLIHESGSISRSDIALRSGYSNFLVSKICDSLLLEGLITEIGSGDSTGGRRPTLLSVRPGLGRIVGVHFGTVNARVLVSDVAGNKLAFITGPSRVKEGPEIALPNLADLIAAALERAGTHVGEVNGIGLSISGIFDHVSGTTLSWPKVPSWINVPVREFLAERYTCLFAADDTPRAMALAERRFGVARDAQEFIYVMLGAGIGSALFLRGELYTGKEGFAGEFGHVIVDENGPVCACGSRGCLETLVSASALVRRAEDALAEGLSSSLWRSVHSDQRGISVELIVEAAQSGDRFCLRLLNEAAAHLGKGIIALTHLLNPELIVLGGAVARVAGPVILPTVQRLIAERALSRPAACLDLRISSLGDEDWARGASLLVTGEVLKHLFLRSATAHSVTRDMEAEENAEVS